jgi:hypothetical protein
MPRFSALKLKYEQLKSNYGALSRFCERLENGSASETTELLERIRSRDEKSALAKVDRTLRHSNDVLQPAEYDIAPVDDRNQFPAGFGAASARETWPRSNFARGVSGIAEERGSIDPESSGELDQRHDFELSSNALFQNPDFGNLQASGASEQEPRSQISVSHKVLL